MKATGFGGGQYIKADEAKTPFAVTILGAEAAEFKDGTTGRTQRKLVLILDKAGEEKKLSLNKSNLDALISAFGDETDNWVGKRMAIYFDPSVEFGGKKVGGVRIKLMGIKSKAELALEAQRQAEALMAAQFEAPDGTLTPATPSREREPGDDDLPI